MPPLTTAKRRTASPPNFLFWLLVYTGLWYLLSAGAGWTFGVPSVCLASLLAVYLGLQPWRMRVRHLPLFILFFLGTALAGAADVARRSIQSHCRIAPSWVRYRFTTTDPRVRLLVSALVGLFPGTLASNIEGNDLRVHILDETMQWRSTVMRLENELVQLLPPPQHSPSAT